MKKEMKRPALSPENTVRKGGADPARNRDGASGTSARNGNVKGMETIFDESLRSAAVPDWSGPDAPGGSGPLLTGKLPGGPRRHGKPDGHSGGFRTLTGNLKPYTRENLLTYLGVFLAFVVISILRSRGLLSRSLTGQLIPICCYMSMAVSLNLTVGILGELSLGHAGFMSVGAFSGIVAAMSLRNILPSAPARLLIAVIVGAAFAAAAGVLVGTPVLRLRGDYLAIVTLAFGEIIKELINCLIVGADRRGIHVLFNLSGSRTVDDLHLADGGLAIIKGAQGAVGVSTIATFRAGFLLVLATLFVVLNLKYSRAGRAIMALRDNPIAAESVGVNLTKYKMMAFVTSASLAGAAGALYGLNYSSLQATKFNFNTSILVLVFVVLGGLGNIRGSLIAAALLTVLPELSRAFGDYRMLVYAIVLILVMLATNSPQIKLFFARLRGMVQRNGAGESGGTGPDGGAGQGGDSGLDSGAGPDGGSKLDSGTGPDGGKGEAV